MIDPSAESDIREDFYQENIAFGSCKKTLKCH